MVTFFPVSLSLATSEDGPTGHRFEVSHSRCQQGHGMRESHVRFQDLTAFIAAGRCQGPDALLVWKAMGRTLKFCLCDPLPRRGGSALLCPAREDPTGNTQQGQVMGCPAGSPRGSGDRSRVQACQTANLDRDSSPWGKCRDSAAGHEVQEGLSHRQ